MFIHSSLFALTSDDPSQTSTNNNLQMVQTAASSILDLLGNFCANIHINLQHNLTINQEDLAMLQSSISQLIALYSEQKLVPVGKLWERFLATLNVFNNEQINFNFKNLELLSDLISFNEVLLTNILKLSVEDVLAEVSVVENKFNEINANDILESTDSLDNPEEYPWEPTPDEMQTFTKFFDRNEKLFCAILAPGLYKTRDDLLKGEQIDNLLRVGDLIYTRTCEVGSIIVFAAELDASILEQIIGVIPIELSKKVDAMGVLPDPWNTVLFTSESFDPDSTSNNTQNASSKPAANESILSSPQISQNIEIQAPTTVVTSTVVSEQPTITAEPPKHIEIEDFDSKNLNPNTVFEKPDLDPEMLQDFLSSAEELMDQLGNSLLDLEKDPQNTEAIALIFRAAHTIKGTSGMFGLRAIERLTHVMENLLDRIRKNQLAVSAILIDALLFGLDRIRNMFSSLTSGKTAEFPINDALQKLQCAGEGVAVTTPTLSKQDTGTTASSSTINTSIAQDNQIASDSIPAIKPSVEVKKVEAKPDAKSAEAAGTIRVDLKRLDSLVNLVGELVIDRTRFSRIEEELRARTGDNELGHLMSESVLIFSRHMNEVQSVIMKIRMVPIGNAFHKFTRVVRDLSKQCGKEIDLQIDGGDTELDKTLVEEIGDPLVHLIRNSIDHGIELPEDRVKAGKPRRGLISIRAGQDGNMIVITFKDDGKGLQVERLRNKAIQNGLIKENETLTDKETYNLIFEAGFSTAEKVTNISGRGVGMDVVKKNILKLKGVIELDSKLGAGTTTTIKLPLTLAIIPSLMVETMNEHYAIPLVNVVESIRITPEDIQKVGTADFVKLRDRVLPLVKLTDFFALKEMDERLWYKVGEIIRNKTQEKPAKLDLNSGANAPNIVEISPTPTLEQTKSNRSKRGKPRLIFVVVGVGEKRIGLVVEQLSGQQEIVIKPLGRLIEKPRGVAGSCVLGNGSVALVLDIGELIDDFSRSNKGYANRV